MHLAKMATPRFLNKFIDFKHKINFFGGQAIFIVFKTQSCGFSKVWEND